MTNQSYEPFEGGVLGEEEEEDLASDTRQFAVFYVGECRYGIDIMLIRRVIAAAPYPVREVPLAPDLLEGVITLRGVVIPVIDLRKKFKVEIDEKVNRLNKLIIVSVHGHIVCFKVDRVHGELRVPSDSIRPAPSMLDDSLPSEAGIFAGICKMEDDVVFLLNVEKLVHPVPSQAA